MKNMYKGSKMVTETWPETWFEASGKPPWMARRI